VLSAAGDGVHKVQGAIELAALHEAAHAHVALPPLGPRRWRPCPSGGSMAAV
jgi:hypothetical protein